MKKRLFICLVILILVVGLVIIFFNQSTDDKFAKLGYNKNEISLIKKNVPKNSYSYVLKKYDKSLINLISAKDYKEKNFEKYIKYYEKNSDSNINDIITIINSGYNLDKYPASSLLAKLVKEKYYLNKNVARYLDYGNNNKIDSKKIISLVNSNVDFGFYNKTEVSNLDDDNLVLVNKFYHLPDKYEPSDLVTLNSKYNKGSNNKMRKEASEAFMKMVDAALLDNIILKNASAYRSYDYQVNLYNNYVNRDGKVAADIYSARPGYSEHQTGLCSDINTIDSSFDNTNESKWLVNNAYKYGFILRFPKNKEDITGYKYESWHYRYVGTKAAKIIHENDLTLEEYYAYYIKK